MITFRNLLKILKNEEGASAVEFAILAPALILIVFGIIYFGFIFNDYVVLTHGAREGIRHASLHEDGTATKAAIMSATTSLDQTKLTIVIDPYDDRPDGETVTVSLTYPVKVELPLISNILSASSAWDAGSSSLMLSTQARMRIE